VREFFVENALHWIHEYHVDGLRLDATHELYDESERHLLAEIAAAAHAGVRRRVGGARSGTHRACGP
jgi:1,4-alpha-glucan branching enzyme